MVHMFVRSLFSLSVQSTDTIGVSLRLLCIVSNAQILLDEGTSAHVSMNCGMWTLSLWAARQQGY